VKQPRSSTSPWKWRTVTVSPHGCPRPSSANCWTTPPAWLVQSKANRTGKRPVWVQLTCAVCGFSEAARPKKWWPDFTYVCCAHHEARDIPVLGPGLVRSVYDGVGSRFAGIVDAAVPEA
jgi:hypothetical protein